MSEPPAAIDPWLARARDSLPVLLCAGFCWALGLAGLAALLDRPNPSAVVVLVLAGWLLAVPGALGLYFGKWLWLLPVAAGLAAFALIAPAGLDSSRGNLTLPAVIFAFAPVAVLTGFGAALRPRPVRETDQPEADRSSAVEMPQGE